MSCKCKNLLALMHIYFVYTFSAMYYHFSIKINTYLWLDHAFFMFCWNNHCKRIYSLKLDKAFVILLLWLDSLHIAVFHHFHTVCMQKSFMQQQNDKQLLQIWRDDLASKQHIYSKLRVCKCKKLACFINLQLCIIIQK